MFVPTLYEIDPGVIPAGGAAFSKARITPRGAVTQITSISTAVTINALWGEITTVSQTLAAAAEASFVVNNNLVQATDVVVVVLRTANGGAGVFLVGIQAVANGSFTVTIANLDAAAGNSVLNISFCVFKNPFAGLVV